MSSTTRPVDHRAIEKCAATWLARRDSGEWSSEDRARLAEWLNEATAHRVAFLRLERVWEGARRARALGASLPGTVPPADEWRQSPFFQSITTATERRSSGQRPSRWWIAAACFALFVGLGAAGYIFKWFLPGNVYSTRVGIISSVSLADGSVVTLNTASRIRIEFQPKERRIVLERGEAFFIVKRNSARPFVVLAGNQRVVDVGTQFSVRRDPTRVQVIVTEGTVKLESPPAAAPSTTGSLPSPPLPQVPEGGVPLSAGTIAIAQDGDLLVHKETIPETEAMVSWREGYLTFRDTTLADAVAEFNRYNVRQITIADPQIGAIRISGKFRPTNYEAFVRLLHEGYDVEVRDSGEGINLSKD